MRIPILQAPFIPLDIELCGGLERIEIEEVTRFNKMGHKSELYVSKYTGNYSKKPGWVKIINDHGWWNNRLLKWLYPIKFVIKNIGADVYVGYYTPYLALIAGRKAFIHFQGLAVKGLPLYQYEWARNRYHKAHYVFCAKHVKSDFLKIYPDIPEKQLHVIYNGIDAERFTPNPTINKITKLSFHGRWTESKGILKLIDALRILEDQGLAFEAVIAGGSGVGISPKGEEYTDKVFAAAKGLKNVSFCGPIKYNELPQFIQKMDFCIVPSINQDPFPLVPLEIMACGRPIIAFRAGGLTEAIDERKEGLLVELNNIEELAKAIKTMIENKTLREEMGLKARQKVLKLFTWEKHCADLFDLYKKV